MELFSKERFCTKRTSIKIPVKLVKNNNKYFKQVTALLNGTKIKKVNHEKFKEITRNGGNVTFVRTGEATPYANIILISGVTF